MDTKFDAARTLYVYSCESNFPIARSEVTGVYACRILLKPVSLR